MINTDTNNTQATTRRGFCHTTLSLALLALTSSETSSQEPTRPTRKSWPNVVDFTQGEKYSVGSSSSAEERLKTIRADYIAILKHSQDRPVILMLSFEGCPPCGPAWELLKNAQNEQANPTKDYLVVKIHVPDLIAIERSRAYKETQKLNNVHFIATDGNGNLAPLSTPRFYCFKNQRRLELVGAEGTRRVGYNDIGEYINERKKHYDRVVIARHKKNNPDIKKTDAEILKAKTDEEKERIDLLLRRELNKFISKLFAI